MRLIPSDRYGETTMVEVRVGSAHVLDELGFAVAASGFALRVPRSAATNYVKLVCREQRVEEYFFFSADPRSRARALDMMTRRCAALAQVAEVRLSTWAPCPGMPPHVRAINVPFSEE